jgi:hypothetical protein
MSRPKKTTAAKMAGLKQKLAAARRSEALWEQAAKSWERAAVFAKVNVHRLMGEADKLREQVQADRLSFFEFKELVQQLYRGTRNTPVGQAVNWCFYEDLINKRLEATKPNRDVQHGPGISKAKEG